VFGWTDDVSGDDAKLPLLAGLPALIVMRLARSSPSRKTKARWRAIEEERRLTERDHRRRRD
jgi:hypothetical protein